MYSISTSILIVFLCQLSLKFFKFDMRGQEWRTWRKYWTESVERYATSFTWSPSPTSHQRPLMIADPLTPKNHSRMRANARRKREREKLRTLGRLMEDRERKYTKLRDKREGKENYFIKKSNRQTRERKNETCTWQTRQRVANLKI